MAAAEKIVMEQKTLKTQTVERCKPDKGFWDASTHPNRRQHHLAGDPYALAVYNEIRIHPTSERLDGQSAAPMSWDGQVNENCTTFDIAVAMVGKQKGKTKGDLLMENEKHFQFYRDKLLSLLKLSVDMMNAINAIEPSKTIELSDEALETYLGIVDDIDNTIGNKTQLRDIFSRSSYFLQSINWDELQTDAGEAKIEELDSLSSDLALVWQQLARLVVATDHAVSAKLEEQNNAIVDGNTLKKTSGVAKRSASTSYSTKSFKAVGDLMKCIELSKTHSIKVICYFAYMIEVLDGILSSLAQFVKILNIQIGRNTE